MPANKWREANMIGESDIDTIGVGYTLATGRLFCPFVEFHKFVEKLMDRPIFTHEFADKDLWEEMKKTFEEQTIAIMLTLEPTQ